MLNQASYMQTLKRFTIHHNTFNTVQSQTWLFNTRDPGQMRNSTLSERRAGPSTVTSPRFMIGRSLHTGLGGRSTGLWRVFSTIAWYHYVSIPLPTLWNKKNCTMSTTPNPLLSFSDFVISFRRIQKARQATNPATLNKIFQAMNPRWINFFLWWPHVE